MLWLVEETCLGEYVWVIRVRLHPGLSMPLYSFGVEKVRHDRLRYVSM
jgi:hypothetical protein